jgi:aspartyl/asparaginyl-tRNA synthetase
VVGKIVKSLGKNQVVELQATEATLLGACVPGIENRVALCYNASLLGQYPLAKKGHKLETLRTLAHLRVRTNTVSCIA